METFLSKNIFSWQIRYSTKLLPVQSHKAPFQLTQPKMISSPAFYIVNTVRPVSVINNGALVSLRQYFHEFLTIHLQFFFSTFSQSMINFVFFFQFIPKEIFYRLYILLECIIFINEGQNLNKEGLLYPMPCPLGTLKCKIYWERGQNEGGVKLWLIFQLENSKKYKKF